MPTISGVEVFAGNPGATGLIVITVIALIIFLLPYGGDDNDPLN